MGATSLWAWTAPAAIAASAVGAVLAALPLAALWTPRGRTAATALAATYKITLLAFCVALLGLLAPALAAGAGDGRAAAALRDIAAIAGLGLGAFGVAALAAAGRWRPINATLLGLGAVTALVSTTAGAARGDGNVFALFPDRDAGIAFFGLVAAQALVTLGDELGRRAPMGGRDALAPLSRRTLVPVLAGLSSVLMIAAGGSRVGVVVAVATLALTAAAWTLREKRAGVLAFRLAATVLAFLAAGLALAWAAAPGAAGGITTGDAASALATWIDRVGAIGAVLIGVAVAAALIQIGRAEDRGRAPARGIALALGAVTLALLTALLSPTAAAAPILAWAAMQIGLAAGVIDLDLKRQPAGQLVAAST